MKKKFRLLIKKSNIYGLGHLNTEGYNSRDYILFLKNYLGSPYLASKSKNPSRKRQKLAEMKSVFFLLQKAKQNFLTKLIIYLSIKHKINNKIIFLVKAFFDENLYDQQEIE